MKEVENKKIDSLIQLIYANGNHLIPYSEFYASAGQNYEDIMLVEGLIEIFPYGDLRDAHYVRLTPTGNLIRTMEGGFAAYIKQKNIKSLAESKIASNSEKAVRQNLLLIILLILTFAAALAALYFSTYHYTNLHNY